VLVTATLLPVSLILHQWFHGAQVRKTIHLHAPKYLLTLYIEHTLRGALTSRFGGLHGDYDDALGGTTNMFSISDLPPKSEPGRFYFTELGIWVRMDYLKSVNFLGQCHHVGTPSMAAQGVEPSPDGVRGVVVNYLPSVLLEAKNLWPLGSLPSGDTYYVPPEAFDPE
jgi:hypothetical protein